MTDSSLYWHDKVTGELHFEIVLTQEEEATLLMMLGYATGAAAEVKNHVLSRRFLRLANTLMQHNPDWTKYEVPDDPPEGQNNRRESA
jgi:hypothetical protein